MSLLDFAALASTGGDGGSTSITTLIVGALGAGGLGAIVAAVVAGLFSRRKLGAEATEIITKAAAGVVMNLEAELTRQVRARQVAQADHDAALQDMASAHVAERAEWQRVLQLHVAWDAIVIAKMAELGHELPPAPPLLPAVRHVDETGHPIHH